MNAENKVEVSPEESRSRRPRAQEEMRVLAVDDDHNILQLLKTALSAFHFDISISDSGANALKQMARQDKPFDCFLLDIQMPAMNGIMLCKEIRKMPEYKHAPILMLTAMSDREYIDLAFVAGATDYVTKPFDFLELRSRMSAAQRLVQERRTAEANGPKNDSGRPKPPLDEPIGIDGIDRVLQNAEFDNYIMQLSQGRLFNTHAMAVKVSGIEELHKSLSAEGFEQLLRDVALSMANLTKKTGDIICYRGGGVFLQVKHGRFAGQAMPLEASLNRMILSRQAQRQSTSEAQIITGESVSLRSLSKSGSLLSISRAIESVEQRDQLLREQRQVVRRAINGEPDPAQKRVYQGVLNDLYRDEPDLRNE